MNMFETATIQTWIHKFHQDLNLLYLEFFLDDILQMLDPLQSNQGEGFPQPNEAEQYCQVFGFFPPEI